MCLYPKLIDNPKYKPNKKNGGIIPPVSDERVKLVPIKCNRCIECRKAIARDWQMRLHEEIKKGAKAQFVTLTFNTESIKKLQELEIEKKTRHGVKYKLQIKELDPYDQDNALAAKAVRLFLERWRKTTGKSVKHWFITELGGGKYEHLHLHGIIWTTANKAFIEDRWQYGHVWAGHEKHGIVVNYVNSQTVNYITKYVHKVDERHKMYKPAVLSSDGIGKDYVNKHDRRHQYKPKNTIEYYKTPTGHKLALPVYFRNKLFTEEEREKLWVEKLDKQIRYVCGEKVSIKDGYQHYDELVKWHRARNERLGYGNDEKNGDREQYEKQRRKLLLKRRMQGV